MPTHLSDPGDSDEPVSRWVALATYADYVEFVERLPTYLADVTRDLEARVRQAESTEETARQGGRQLSATARRARLRSRGAISGPG